MRKSEQFERQIERIHQLIEGEGAEVTWDDRIPDPDNPDQLRQIDVTIRYPNSFTIVECRIHAEPQDVKWIEELIGRRQSLNADAVIAVSASGYTSGAIKKASTYGIILRHLFTLSEYEIKNWGKTTRMHLTFYEFRKTVVTFKIDFAVLGPEISFTDPYGKGFEWRPLFQTLMDKFDDKDFGDRVAAFNAEIGEHPIHINGVKPEKMSISGSAVRVKKTISLASVVAYAAPVGSKTADTVHVEHFDLGEFEIIQNFDETLVIIDLSSIKIPENCLFRTLNLDFGRVVNCRVVDIIGIHEAMDFENKISFKFVS